MPDTGRAVSNLTMYVFAKEHYLKTLLQSGKITQERYERINDLLYERFQIASVDAFYISVLSPPQSQPDTENSSELTQIPAAGASAQNIARIETASVIYNNDTAVEYVSLTQLAREYKPENPGYVIQSWLQSQNTIEFLKLWEEANNPAFDFSACKDIQSKLRDNTFTLTAKYWIEQTNGKGLQSKSGRYGGTFAHPVIACDFLAGLSPRFKLLLIEMGQVNDSLAVGR